MFVLHILQRNYRNEYLMILEDLLEHKLQSTVLIFWQVAGWHLESSQLFVCLSKGTHRL
jgi:hypothetical protein